MKRLRVCYPETWPKDYFELKRTEEKLTRKIFCPSFFSPPGRAGQGQSLINKQSRVYIVSWQPLLTNCYLLLVSPIQIDTFLDFATSRSAKSLSCAWPLLYIFTVLLLKCYISPLLGVSRHRLLLWVCRAHMLMNFHLFSCKLSLVSLICRATDNEAKMSRGKLFFSLSHESIRARPSSQGRHHHHRHFTLNIKLQIQ